MPPAKRLTVAVTGPTGTFGFDLRPVLQPDRRIEKIVGIARRPFDPKEHGWTKMEYRQGDVRDPDALKQAFEDADAVVHLAFMIMGNADRATIREINVEGTLNTFRAAAAAGAKRFVYASSVAAYGFHDDNPVPMPEDWPVRPAAHLFYAQEKAELEQLLFEENEKHANLDLYLLRPPIVLGPHAMGAKDALPAPVAAFGKRLLEVMSRIPIPVPTAAPDVPVQFIHEADVGQALLKCVVAAGPAGAYNIAGDGVMSGRDVARELGLSPLSIPGKAFYAVTRPAAKLPKPPFAPPATDWVEAVSHPAIMDTTKARKELGWKPKYSALEALRDTLPTRPNR